MKMLKAVDKSQFSNSTSVKSRSNLNGFIKLMLISTFMFVLCLNITANSEKTTPKTEKTNPKVSTNTQTETSKTNTPASMTKNEFLAKMKSLENQRRKLSLQIYELRVKLIKEKPELEILQKAVLDMHRKMGIELNKNVDMKQLLIKAKQMDNQMITLIKENGGDQS